MKTNVCIILTLSIMTCSSFAQEKEVTNIIAAVRGHIAEERINPLNYPFIAKDIPGFKKLAQSVSSLEPEQAAMLTQLTTDIQVQAVIVFAAQQFKPRQYLRFAEKIVELGTSKKLPYQIVSATIYPQEDLPNLLVDNYRDTQVRRILETAKLVYHDKPQILVGLENVLNGEGKTDLDRRRSAGFPKSDTPPPPIQLDQDSSDSP